MKISANRGLIISNVFKDIHAIVQGYYLDPVLSCSDILDPDPKLNNNIVKPTLFI